MKGKQAIGIVVACVMFILVGMSSYVTRQMAAEVAGDTSIVNLFASSLENNVTLPTDPFIGVVRVEGTITDTGSSSVFDTVSYDHKATLDYINKMMNSDTNEGILLYVNSPGGTVYHSDELYLKLKEYKEQTGRPVWTYMADQACSGGYYISMASDHIGMNRNGWTGSIGVIVSLTNYSELYKKLGVKEIDITSGANKSMGSSGLPLTEEQREIFQGIVDESYEQFVGIVSEGRNMPLAKTKKLADGRIYTAKQALENGLIDEVVTTYKDYEKEFRKEVGGGVTFYEPSFGTDNIFASLFSEVKDLKSKSEAEVLSEFIEEKGSGVPMYYAKTGK
ncbi:signal peptide peptidase SppA [Velocimicrobium porci]|uniref:Signal peptide peptidase SppA n=1 Tax=Velocimicrobium porci TaxID=2606634 RepID=A0A6L5Y0M4_9FIRM|nr:signal peptide peptidase SppA [Velocimicrobium porci]MSS64542.1 signal peptide peptidase SppA [Velocimicrobium porci]